MRRKNFTQGSFKKSKQLISECILGAALGAGFMASFLWVGLDMHLPEQERPAVVEAACVVPEHHRIRPGVEEREQILHGHDSEVREAYAARLVLDDETEPETDEQDVSQETQDVSQGFSQSDLDLLAAIVYAEAGDQDFVGQRLVADVVLNRVASPAWPSTISEVVYQPGQFSPVTDGGLDRAWGRVTESCYEAVRLALAGERIDTQVIYFSMYGCANGEFAFQHGDHYFGY